MKAITVEPGRADSLTVEEFDAPTPGPGELLVRGLALGVCGTDHDLNSGGYGWAPEGHKRLIIVHESLGEVISAPEGSDFAEGDLVVGVVRRPDPEPCGACARGEFDMCRNGEYRERGIKEIDGFGSQEWVVDKDFVVKVDRALGKTGALLEPTSVVAKAWDQVDRVGNRAWNEPTTVVITGAGPVGLLAALIGQQRGLDVHVVDRVEDGIKPKLVADLGATYHTGEFREILDTVDPDIIIETTGAGPLVGASLTHAHPYPVVCLLGIQEGDPMEVDIAAAGKRMVLNNTAVVGSVNANVDHWRAAAKALGDADRDWLSSLVTRVVPLSNYEEAFDHRDDDIKVLIDLQA
ncbi:glucose 1-dehydrogenase [Corynebacterium sp. AOP12-C2-36]|uniref:glucose 1-dehydrogenase n=1 Tax=Corynebacterium sp. AOP12-C2-36 TaxID=3457723 RepID=UPI0040344DAF